jgi:hypothetical protein
LRIFLMDVAKVDRGMLHMGVLEACCKRLFKMFYMFSDICCNRFFRMLHMFSHICCNSMFQIFKLFQSYVAVSVFPCCIYFI